MVLVAIRVAVYNGPKFIALSLGTRALTFDLRSEGLGREDRRAALGGPAGHLVVGFE